MNLAYLCGRRQGAVPEFPFLSSSGVITAELMAATESRVSFSFFPNVYRGQNPGMLAPTATQPRHCLNRLPGSPHWANPVWTVLHQAVSQVAERHPGAVRHAEQPAHAVAAGAMVLRLASGRLRESPLGLVRSLSFVPPNRCPPLGSPIVMDPIDPL